MSRHHAPLAQWQSSRLLIRWCAAADRGSDATTAPSGWRRTPPATRAEQCPSFVDHLSPGVLTGTVLVQWRRFGETALSRSLAESCPNRACHPTGFMIADTVRYMSVHSWKQPDFHGHSGTTPTRKGAAREPGYAQATGRFRRWWQVLGSNQRRLSRRFYRPPIPTHRNTH